MSNERLEFFNYEKLDELIKVTNTKGWLALLSALFLIALMIIWLFYGEILTQVRGTGIIINMAGIKSINSNASGRINHFAVMVGDEIDINQPIAFIIQPNLLKEINNLKQKVQEYQFYFEKKEIMRNSLKKRYEEELVVLNKKIQLQEKITTDQKEEKLLATKEKIFSIQNQLDILNIEKQNEQFNLNQLLESLRSLQEKNEKDSIIKSPFKGHIISLNAAEDDTVDVYTTLATLEESNKKELQAIIFVSPIEGKKVFPGMTTFIIPTIKNSEEYGSLKGVVQSVSSYPVNFAGMMKVLHNEELVKQFIKNNMQIQIVVNLIPNSKTTSGYEWTSGTGPATKILGGTWCNATIIIKSKHPIDLIIPKIKKLHGISHV